MVAVLVQPSGHFSVLMLLLNSEKKKGLKAPFFPKTAWQFVSHVTVVEKTVLLLFVIKIFQ